MNRRSLIASLIAALAVFMAVAVPVALADDGGVSITQVANQVNTTVQAADASCTVTPGSDNSTLDVGCSASASNSNSTIQQICQVAAAQIANTTIECIVNINTNVPVPGPKGGQGPQGSEGSQGPQGPAGHDGISFLAVPLPTGMTCPAGSSGGVALEAFLSSGDPVLGPDGNPVYKGPICNGVSAVQCPNFSSPLKYFSAHDISVMTGKIVVMTTNPAGQTACVSKRQAAAWHKPPKPQIKIIIEKVPGGTKSPPPASSNTK